MVDWLCGWSACSSLDWCMLLVIAFVALCTSFGSLRLLFFYFFIFSFWTILLRLHTSFRIQFNILISFVGIVAAVWDVVVCFFDVFTGDDAGQLVVVWLFVLHSTLLALRFHIFFRFRLLSFMLAPFEFVQQRSVFAASLLLLLLFDFIFNHWNFLQ